MQKKLEVLTKWLKNTDRSDLCFDDEHSGAIERAVVDGQVKVAQHIGGLLEEILSFSDEQIDKELGIEKPDVEIKAHKFNARDTDSVNIAVEFTMGKEVPLTILGHLNVRSNMAHLSASDEQEARLSAEGWNIELDEIEKRIESREIELI